MGRGHGGGVNSFVWEGGSLACMSKLDATRIPTHRQQAWVSSSGHQAALGYNHCFGERSMFQVPGGGEGDPSGLVSSAGLGWRSWLASPPPWWSGVMVGQVEGTGLILPLIATAR